MGHGIGCGIRVTGLFLMALWAEFFNTSHTINMEASFLLSLARSGRFVWVSCLNQQELDNVAKLDFLIVR